MPGTVGITVNGVYIVRPGAFSVIDSSAMVPLRSGGAEIVGVIGQSDGGIPGIVYEFSSYPEALGVLRRGEALSYVKRIFNPSPDRAGAYKLRFVRLGDPTQASADFGGCTFESLDYGRHCNGISVKIVAGTVSGTWSVQVKKPADRYSRTYTVGLGLNVKSSATTPKLIFDHAKKLASLYESAAVVATFAYPTESVTLRNLASWINGRTGWTATISGNPAMPVCFMNDPILAEAPAIVALGVELPAEQGALKWVIGAKDPHVQITDVDPGDDGATYGALGAEAEASLTAGSGTGDDVIEAADFDAPLLLLEAVKVDHLFLCSPDEGVQAKGLDHCVALTEINRKRWRIFYTGGPVDETAAEAAARAQALDGPVVYGWNGTADSNPETGLPEQLGGLAYAAQMCGLAAGCSPSTPLTNKAVKSTSLEVPAPSDTVIDDLLEAGVTPCAYDPVTGRSVIVQCLTTWQGGANVMYRKHQGLRIQYAIHRGVQLVLSEFVGEPMDLLTGNRIKARMAAWLDSSVRNAKNTEGFLTQGFKDGAPTPAWENLTVTGDGIDLWTIAVECHPVTESAFVVVMVKLTPASIEV